MAAAGDGISDDAKTGRHRRRQSGKRAALCKLGREQAAGEIERGVEAGQVLSFHTGALLSFLGDELGRLSGGASSGCRPRSEVGEGRSDLDERATSRRQAVASPTLWRLRRKTRRRI